MYDYLRNIPRLEAQLQRIRALHRTAVMVEQISGTRFASAERVLRSFIRALPALMKVVGFNDDEKREFEENLYCVPASRREKRQEDFLCRINLNLSSWK